MEEKVYIRSDLNQTGTKTAYFRITKELKDFIDLVIEKDKDIDAIVLSFDEGKKDWNIGFIVPD